MKKWMVFLLTICLMLCGCSSDGAVYVQSVEALSNMGGIAPGDHFLGLVVSEHVTKIEKDSDKAVKELLVQEGDDVKEGDVLCVLEAMKMENEIMAPKAGTVAQVLVQKGSTVNTDDTLVVLN